MAITLTPRSVAALKPREIQYDVWDAKVHGLGVRVSPSGVKSWTIRYRIGRRLRRMSLGAVEVVKLAQARTDARVALREANAGRDPALVKVETREADTIGKLAADYLEKYAMVKKRSWKDDRRRLRVSVLPMWRHRAAKGITRRDVRDLIQTVVSRGPIEANRVRALLHKLFAYGVEQEIVPTNPVTGTPRPGVEHQRDRVLGDDEIRKLWVALDKEPIEMAAAFRLRLVTAQRGGEVHNMRWPDVDLNNAMWTIPAEHSKNKLPHRVPLSKPALEILKELRAAHDAAIIAHAKRPAPIYVLAGARGKRQRGRTAATFGLEDFRGHDLRRSAASGMASAGVPRLVIGKILNHIESGITAVYDRHSYDREKKIGLETWARKLTAILEAKSAAVVPFVRPR